jgi:hypothetical protein
MKTKVFTIAVLVLVLGLISLAFAREPRTMDLVGHKVYADARGVFAGLGHKVYLANGSYGLWIVNVDDRSNPVDMGHTDPGGVAWDVYVEGDYAYLAAGSWGLSVIDVSNPYNPQPVSRLDTPGAAYGVFWDEDYKRAYVADGGSGLRVINVSTPGNPFELGFCNTPGSAQDVFVVHPYAYVADEAGGLRIIDVSDPTDPDEVASFDTPGHAYGVHVVEDSAYIATVFPQGGLVILNVSDPESPEFLGYYQCQAWDLYVYGNHAYIADWSQEIKMFDVSNSMWPEETDSYPAPNLPYGVHGTVSVYVYLASHSGGLYNFIAKGDVVEDHVINVLDILRITNIILGNPPPPTPYELWAADVDDDGDIDVLDNLKLVNVFLGVWTDPEITEPAELWLARVPGPTGSYNVMLENGFDVGGVQITISYNPHAMHPGIPQTTERSAGLDLHYAIGSSEVVILLYSTTGEVIAPGTGTIVHIPLESPGGGSAHITDALLGTIDAQDYPVIIRRMGPPKVASQQLPTTYSLSQNYPNPFNPETTIEYAVPEAGKVKVQVYNLLGQEVEVLIDCKQEAGHHAIKWNAADMASGVYFYRLTAGEFSETKRMVLMR